MFILGEELLFQIGGLNGEKVLGEIYLKYLGEDKRGIKMGGNIPNFWNKTGEGISGPKLHQSDYIYQIVDLDLNKSRVWLREAGFDSHRFGVAD
jgi:hypothetical protein